MEMKENSNDVFLGMEEKMFDKINHSFSVIIKEVNESLGRILTSAIQTAENLEYFIKNEIRSASQIFESNFNVRHKISFDNINSYKGSDKIINLESFKPKIGRISLASNTIENEEIKIKSEDYALIKKRETNEFQNSKTNQLESLNNTNLVQEVSKTVVLNPESDRLSKEECRDKNEKQLQCTECDYTASLRANLKRHENSIHYKIRNFECTQCSYASFRKETLSRHITRIHHK